MCLAFGILGRGVAHIDCAKLVAHKVMGDLLADGFRSLGAHSIPGHLVASHGLLLPLLVLPLVVLVLRKLPFHTQKGKKDLG